MHTGSLTEEWRPIPGLQFYEASNLGRIRSLGRTLELSGRWRGVRRFHRGKVLQPKLKPNRRGVIYLSFYAGKGIGDQQVNRSVCAAFNGPPPSEIHEAAHLDRDTSNNSSENLTWATPSQNADHKTVHGTVLIGSKNFSSKIQESDVLTIFEEYCSGSRAVAISERFKLSKPTIFEILSGKCWRHVEVGSLRQKASKRIEQNRKS